MALIGSTSRDAGETGANIGDIVREIQSRSVSVVDIMFNRTFFSVSQLGKLITGLKENEDTRILYEFTTQLS